MKAFWTAMAAAAVLAAPLQAQLGTARGLAVEVRGGTAAGNYGPAASEFVITPRLALGASVSYGVTEHVGVYAGVSRSSFGCDTGFCEGRDVGFTSRGVDAGAELRLPLPAAPWIRAGLVHHSLHYRAGNVADEGEQTSGAGFSAGGGVELRVGRRLSVTPGVRYVRYGAADDDGVALLVGDVGLKIRM